MLGSLVGRVVLIWSVLVPSVGYGENTGVDVSAPYYFNLAENYDLTLTPRLMSKRGLMLSSEFRFLTSSTQGTFAADILPNDRERDTGNSTRGAASLYTYSTFNERANAALRLNYVSDSDYFEDLGGSLSVTALTHLNRSLRFDYFGRRVRFFGQIQDYQTIDDAILPQEEPYRRLPQLLVNAPTTVVPSSRSPTPSPVSTISPTNSWPSTPANSMYPLVSSRSVAQMPAWRSWTSAPTTLPVADILKEPGRRVPTV